MNAAAAWILAVVVVLSVGGLATAYIRTVLLQRDATAAGIVALSGMSWREFMRIVLEALATRRYARVVDRDTPGSDSDYVLARDGDHWLLSCKHGGAFVLGNSAVNELASNIRLQGAAGGLLVTQGQIAAEARAPAKLQHIELLDGPTLWPEVRHLIPATQLAEITAGAAQRARQRTLLAWLC
ncbi:MAG TPA: restriction endonuclease, partial [Luteimonas sp.]|nr:restriction endonuclease [Luteimonas sp.]